MAADCERGAFVTHGLDPQHQMLEDGADPRDAQPARWADVTLQNRADEPEIERRRLLAGDYGAFYRGMETAVRTGGPVPVSVESALAVMEVLELAQLSADLRRTIEVPATA